MFNRLKELDTNLFHTINGSCSNSFFDFIMPIARRPENSIPFYVFILVCLLFCKERKNILWFILAAGITVLLTDQISAHIIKPIFHRLRPCHVFMGENINIRVVCGSGYSFVSSHAANTFGFALLLISGFRKKYKWIVPVSLIWCCTVSFAQIYVGLHYPFDVFCGALLGTIIGITIGYFYKRVLNKFAQK